MRKIINIAIIVACLAAPVVAIANIAPVQPKIMVVPFVKESEDIRTILEEDVNKRIVLTKIKEAFDLRGFTTVDFLGKLKATSVQEALGNEQQQDFKSMIISNSGADVYVDAEIVIGMSETGNSVKVIVTAYDVSTGSSLSNTVGDSGKFYTDDIGRLASKAIEKCAGDFLTVMQGKFSEIMENGRSINLKLGFAETSEYNMRSEIGDEGLTLADHIELWLGENAYQGNYHIQGTSATQMLVDDLRIPIKDENGANYNVNKFGLSFLKFARSLGLKITRDISNNSLIITIQ